MKTEFRYSPEYESYYKQRKQETIEYILSKDYGATLTNDELAKLLGYSIADEVDFKRYKAQMGHIKNILINYGYILKSISGIGYYILKPKQISGYCYHTYIRRTTDLLAKSCKILAHVDKTELSDVRKQEHSDVTDLNVDLINNIDTTIENSNYGNRKDYYDNLNDDELLQKE